MGTPYRVPNVYRSSRLETCNLSMIWGTSIWRRECLNRSKIRLAQKCYLLGCTPQVRQLAIVTLAARLNLLFKSTLSFENHP
jgi:hypothetical protein